MRTNSEVNDKPQALQDDLRQKLRKRHSVARRDVTRLFVASDTTLSTWLNNDGIEDPADLQLIECQGEKALSLGWPLRLIQPDRPHTVIMRTRPLRPGINTAHLWTQRIEGKAVDYYQAINSRIQNHYAHLRHMPGTYDLDSMGDDELRSCAPTNRAEFAFPENNWTNMVVTWGPTGYDLSAIQTQVYINGVRVVSMEGGLRFMHATRSVIMKHYNLEGIGFWERDLLLGGLAITHYAEIAAPLLPKQAEALSTHQWNNLDSFLHGIEDVEAPTPNPTDLFHNAPGVRLKGVDCLNPGENAIRLDSVHANRFHYWHADASDAPNQTALFGFDDDRKLAWEIDIPANDDYHLLLCYQLLMPPPDCEPTLSVSIDGASISDCQNIPLPPTTASGPLRPESKRYKAVTIGAVSLQSGRHRLELTFQNNNYLSLAEILLTPWAIKNSENPKRELMNYVRPPFMEVLSLDEKEPESVYHLRFINAEKFPVSGELRVDESCGSSKNAALSINSLYLDDTIKIAEVQIAVPAEINHQHIRLVFQENTTGNTMIYHLRHRRPFRLAANHSITAEKRICLAIDIVPEAPIERQELSQKLRKDPRLVPWLTKSLEEITNEPPALKKGHHCIEIQLLTQFLILTQDADVAQRLKTILKAHTRLLITSLNVDAHNEERMDTRGGYTAARRGGVFGELHPYDIIALDVLVSMGAIDEKESLFIESNFIWSSFERSKRQFGTILSRGQAHGVIGYFIYANLSGDEEMIKSVEKAMIRYATKQMNSDGTHNEKISSYGSSFDEAIKMGLVTQALNRPSFLEHCHQTIRQSAEAFVAGCFSNGALLRQGDGGVQRGFQLFFNNERVLDKLATLFPDMTDEIDHLKHYQKAQFDRVMAKHNHAPPETWPVVPSELLRSSDLSSEGGWAILRSGEGENRMEASLDWSATGDHGHPDTLNMNIFAFDEVLTDDIGYGFGLSGDYRHLNKTFGYAMRTVSHNTVVADRQCQYPGSKGTLKLFDATSEASVAWASSGGVYHEDIQGDRCLILLKNTLIDLFRIRSGGIRTYDYVLHCFGSPKCSLKLQKRPPFCPPAGRLEKVADFPGYDHLNNLKEGHSIQNVHFSFVLDGYPQALWQKENAWMDYHLGTLSATILNDEESTFILGDAPFPYPDIDSERPFFMASRQCRETVFATVFNTYDKSIASPKIQHLPVFYQKKHLSSVDAYALEIETDDTTTVVIQNNTNASVELEGLGITDAKIAILQSDHQTGKAPRLRAYECRFAALDGYQAIALDQKQNINQILKRR